MAARLAGIPGEVSLLVQPLLLAVAGRVHPAQRSTCIYFLHVPVLCMQDQMAETARQYFEAQGGFLTVAKEMGANVKLDLIHGRCSRSVTNTIVQRVQDLAAELVVLTVQRKRSFIQDLFQASPVSSLPEVCPCPTLIIPAACS